MPPLQIIVVSLIVPIFAAVFLVYQAQIRWEGFSSVIRKDWEGNFRAVIKAGERVEFAEETMGKTPVYLYVWTFSDLISFVFGGYMN